MHPNMYARAPGSCVLLSSPRSALRGLRGPQAVAAGAVPVAAVLAHHAAQACKLEGVQVHGQRDKDGQDDKAAERREHPLPAPAVAQLWQEQKRGEEAADEAADVGEVGRVDVLDNSDDKKDDEEQDEQASQQRPRDGLKVENHVRDEEAHHAKHAAAGAHKLAAHVLPRRADQLAAAARDHPQQRDAPRAVLVLQVQGHRNREQQV
mmetsp:Transcript_34051/g.87055  ORF Transcript_34051/g.87055 Transcript_34051/m.87055 type:complete len:207 (-) Transcript_34051:138-758(-)